MNSTLQHWHAIRVRSRSEKVAEAELTRRGFEVFAAIASQRRVWADRIRTVRMPLFPGYVFGRFASGDRVKVESTPGVASVVRFGPNDAPVDEQEIASVRQIVDSGLEVTRWPQLQVGSPVRVAAGPLKGALGLLTGWKGSHRLQVSISILQRHVSVDIDEALVEPLRSGPVSAAGPIRTAGAA